MNSSAKKGSGKMEHGLDHACYANGPYGLRPYLMCLCGWDVNDNSWESVGQAFDAHLVEVQP